VDDRASPDKVEADEGRGRAEGEEFYERFLAPMENRMMRTAWRIVRNPDQARDALQEALASIWRGRETIRRHPNPEALILRMCIHAAYDSLRHTQRRRRFEAAEHAAPPEHADRTAAAGAGGEISAAEVRSAIGRLPSKQAVALLMHVVEEREYREIAAALGCSENTARTHVLRARRRLSRWLAHLAPYGARATRS
jgi:RNA polymerase sigma-70 factor (ECF subfamily)